MKKLIFAAVGLLAAACCRVAEPKPEPGAFCVNIPAEHPRMVLNKAELEALKAHVASAEQPWKGAWENLQATVEKYASDEWQPDVYMGDNTMDYYKALMRDGDAARDLAIAYWVSGEERYARKGAAILAAWLPKEGALPGTAFDMEVNYPNLGMLTGRSIFPYLYAYDLLKGAGKIPAGADARLEEWLRSRVEYVKQGSLRWRDSNYFDRQWYQNHLVADAMGLMAIAVTLRDSALMQYAVDSPINERDVKELVSGIILMEGQPKYYREPGDWPTQTGEIADRYRHFAIGGHYKDYVTLPDRGLQYCGLSSSLLLSIAEMGRHNGIDVYQYVAPEGENLKLPMLFYSEFYITHDSSVNGGFYAGEDDWINAGDADTWEMWEVANKRWPGEEKFREVLRVNRGNYLSMHQLGPVSLTHAEKID